jgi:aminoglycoside 3-N-acetyltransferase
MKTTDFQDLIELFKQLDIRRGDKVMVHGFFPSLGVIENGYKTFFDALISSIGDTGTLIIPTFSYSYFNHEIYNVLETKSTIGSFTNFFLDHYECYRNLEPNFSMAGKGPDIMKVIMRDTPYVYGRKGIYQKIEDYNVKFILIGINWDQGLPYSMHIEHCFGVDYRYDKEFIGKTIDHKKNIYEDKAVHFVRNLERNPIRYRSRVGKILDEQGISRLVKFQYGMHRSIKAQDYSRVALEKMKGNPYYLLKEIDGKPVEI